MSLAHLFSERVVGLGDIQRDDPFVVATGQYAPSGAFTVFLEAKREAVLRVFLLRTRRAAPARRA